MSELNLVESAADLCADRSKPRNPLEARPGGDQKHAMPYVVVPHNHAVIDLLMQGELADLCVSAKVVVAPDGGLVVLEAHALAGREGGCVRRYSRGGWRDRFL